MAKTILLPPRSPCVSFERAVLRSTQTAAVQIDEEFSTNVVLYAARFWEMSLIIIPKLRQPVSLTIDGTLKNTVKQVAHLRTAFFWAITQRLVVISYRHFGKSYQSRNVGKELPQLAA